MVYHLCLAVYSLKMLLFAAIINFCCHAVRVRDIKKPEAYFQSFGLIVLRFY